MFRAGLLWGYALACKHSCSLEAAEEYLKRGCIADGSSSIEEIAQSYGNQAVVVSIDPRRGYISSPDEAPSH
jgi:glutamine amidotransferase/cyclase